MWAARQSLPLRSASRGRRLRASAGRHIGRRPGRRRWTAAGDDRGVDRVRQIGRRDLDGVLRILARRAGTARYAALVVFGVLVAHDVVYTAQEAMGSTNAAVAELHKKIDEQPEQAPIELESVEQEPLPAPEEKGTVEKGTVEKGTVEKGSAAAVAAAPATDARDTSERDVLPKPGFLQRLFG